ncbi:unnamed protein product [Owenia fusiformis]|uniref:Protein HIRA n=1 Tax=Owenia fusiformis TaxID=6347 RepID=A0A8S4Q4M9_OWEFU|nr:unnamed protein product [Owenia fusiformis]
MKLLKPAWVTHDGKPIFSIDIHPDGSRFATGGQGEDSGKVVIWNMAPVEHEESETNENVPRMLCTMDNHIACVNCVRWSNNGKYLASAGDDKLIMIWQTSRYAGPSTTFGTGGSTVNAEQWRCAATLRGHSGDVLGLAWSPTDNWLASCSIDNSIIIWNALKFPAIEQVAVLKGHTGLVKGVTWDPVGKYIASQSDDRTLRIWRTLDWQSETVVKEPFVEAGGTTHVLRLDWSPDGFYVVSAHAMNNSGPTAQIIERDGWATNMDFVGHRKAVTVARFNPKIFAKKIKKGSSSPQQYSCCAIGSRDRSLSIWLTALKRPLVVLHDLFKNSVMDISWTPSGTGMLCCSWDGTVAYTTFTHEEIGQPITDEEKNGVFKKFYGKSAKSLTSSTNETNQIIESAAILRLQQQKENAKKSLLQHETPSKTLNGIGGNSNSTQTPIKPTNKQIETRTPDGRRRITPIFLAPQPEMGEAPLPFGAGNLAFSTSTERSSIIVEKSDSNFSPDVSKVSSDEKQLSSKEKDKRPLSQIQPISALDSTASDKPKIHKEKAKDSTENDKTKEKDIHKSKSASSNEKVKKRLDLGGGPSHKRKRKDDVSMRLAPPPPPAAAVTTVPSTTTHSIHVQPTGLNLQALTIDKQYSMNISPVEGSPENDIIIEVENNVVTSSGVSLHRLRCIKSGQLTWEAVNSSRIIAITGNSNIVCSACADCSINLYSLPGRKLLPSLVFDAKAAVLTCNGEYLMLVTCRGSLYIWKIPEISTVIRNESLAAIISGSVTLTSGNVTEEGFPIVTLSNNKLYTFKPDLGCWLSIPRREDPLTQLSDHHSCLPQDGRHSKGPLATLQQQKNKAGSQANRIFQTDPTLQQSTTISHLENQVNLSLALKSSTEYRFWLSTYLRYLAQEGIENKLREICDDLLGPLYKSKTNNWQSKILGVCKRKLLQEILPVIGSNLRLQRLFTEYQEQLDTLIT